MGRLFGTDGARGIANSELTCELAMEIGRAAAAVLAKNESRRPRVLIGMDTRVSSKMLEAALTAGLCSVGADVVQIGVVPTPAVAYLVGHYGMDAGVMISASHNPCEYNGIKLFSSTGYKLSDALEAEIEAIVLDKAQTLNFPTGGELGRVLVEPNALNDYIKHVASSVDVRFDGMRVALDCANGSSSMSAKTLFTGLGAECHMLSDRPDGVNINENCGSTHLGNLIRFVRDNELDMGFAFDGDADRCLAVDAQGNVIDGDRLIAIAAADMKRRGTLKKDTAVVTVMSNMGFWKFAEEEGIHVEKTSVGDRYVLEEMLKSGYNVGGEQSGHIIFLDYATTGDGQLSAAQIMAVMRREGKTLARLAECMTVYPQVLVNIKVTPDGKQRLSTDEAVQGIIADVENRLGDDGRVLVRVSGTEPLIRVMLEGKDQSVIEAYAEEIADVIRKNLA